MKLLLNQGLPRSAVSLLSDAGIDTIHVSEVGMSEAEDAAILHKAREEQRTIVTLDADFHALLALNAAMSPSVVCIRIERLRASALTQLLLRVIFECNKELEQGAAVTVEPHRIRIRRSPLLPA
jgi:predicted nuclease of predicted toxin-antitoxin system